MRLIMVLVTLIFAFGKPVVSLADTNSNQAALLIQEVNGTNAGRYRVLKLPNGTTTNNNDGSVTLATGAGATSYWTLSGSTLSPTSNSYNVSIGGTFSVLNGDVTFTNPYSNTEMAFSPELVHQGAYIGLNDDVNTWVFGSNGSNNTSGSGVFTFLDVGSYGNPQATPIEFISQNASCAPSGFDPVILGGANGGCNDEIDNTSLLQVLGTANIGYGLIVNSGQDGLNQVVNVFDDNGNSIFQISSFTGEVETRNNEMDDGFTGAANFVGTVTVPSLHDTGLTASRVVFTTAGKVLTSTGIGTSSQFIKGDGSLDSSTYLTTGTATSTYVPYSGATGTVNLNNHYLDNILGLAIGTATNTGLLSLSSTANSDYIYFNDTTANQNCYMGLTTPIGSGPDLTIGRNCNRVIIGDSTTGSNGTYAMRVNTQTVEWPFGINWSSGSQPMIINGIGTSLTFQSNINNTKWILADQTNGTAISGYNTTGTTYLPVILQPNGGGITINGTTAVSCAAGTVNLTTEVITNGIVTHC